MHIRSNGASINVQPVNEGEDEAGVLISSYVLLGANYATKIGADIRLPPLAALALADALVKCANQALALEVSQ